MSGCPAIERRGPMIAAALRRFLAARRRFVWEDHRVDGRRLRVRRSTVAPREPRPIIVLLPGLALSGHYMLPLGAELAERWPVLVPDLPGHLRSFSPRTALDIPELADATARWVRRRGLGPAVLVGNSMGCQVAVEVAARHPHQAARIVLEGPTVDPRARSFARQLGRVLLAGRREPMSLGPLQVADWITTGPRGVIGTVRHTLAHRVEDRLPEVRCPTLVVRGAHDPIVPQRWAQQVSAGVGRGSLITVPGASHALSYSHPRKLAAMVDGFVAGPDLT